MKSLVSMCSVCIGILCNLSLLFSFYMLTISSFSLKHLSSLQLQTLHYVFIKTFLPYFYLLYTVNIINTYHYLQFTLPRNSTILKFTLCLPIELSLLVSMIYILPSFCNFSALYFFTSPVLAAAPDKFLFLLSFVYTCI